MALIDHALMDLLGGELAHVTKQDFSPQRQYHPDVLTLAVVNLTMTNKLPLALADQIMARLSVLKKQKHSEIFVT